MSIRVLLVDDHELVRAGIRGIIESEVDLEVVGEAGHGHDAVRMAKELTPDVVLMDVNMPGMGGIEATSRIRQADPNVAIIILTVHAEAPYPNRLLEAGATGYLTKGCAASELTRAIHTVNRGERYVGADIAQKLALSLLPGAEKSPFDNLSSREMEVMLMLVQGLDIKEVSESLHLSPKTVSTYKYRLFEKLDVKNEVALTRLAIAHGMLDAGASESA